MALRCECPFCNSYTIPKRLLGFYVGSSESVRIWECRECFGLWSEKQADLELVA